MSLQNLRVAIATAGVTALAAAGVAGAATKHSTNTTSTAGTSAASTAAGHTETPLTGATLKSASDAAIAANAGATVNRASTEDPADASTAAYEIKITKADGTRAEVLEDASFVVLSTKADTGHGGRGHHGGGNPNEKALTGTDLAKAKAAAEAAVSGGTADRANSEDPAEGTGAAYEVHVDKADGSHVNVLLDSSFGVIKTVTDSHTHG